MTHKRSGKRYWLAVIFCLATVCWAVSASAQQNLGDWSASFTEGTGAAYHEYEMVVPQDGTVVITTSATGTIVSQFVSISVRDAQDETIKFTILISSPAILSVPLTARLACRQLSKIVRWLLARGHHLPSRLSQYIPRATGS
jgi:hypothetical protein